MLTIEEIRKKMSQGQYDLDDRIDLKISNEEVDFMWDDDEHDLDYEVASIENLSLTFEEVLGILEEDVSTFTTSWNGTVIKRKHFSVDELEDVNEPAYGGFSNTNGIPEMGELYVNREMLEKANIGE